MLLKYRKGYKYQVYEDFRIQTAMKPVRAIITEFIVLDKDGSLKVCKGYAWDGPSGPAVDTKNFMVGSLVHDVFYQLMREGLLPGLNRNIADNELRRICIDRGMSRIRANWVHWAVKTFAKRASEACSARDIFVA